MEQPPSVEAMLEHLTSEVRRIVRQTENGPVGVLTPLTGMPSSDSPMRLTGSQARSIRGLNLAEFATADRHWVRVIAGRAHDESLRSDRRCEDRLIGWRPVERGGVSLPLQVRRGLGFRWWSVRAAAESTTSALLLLLVAARAVNVLRERRWQREPHNR
jgi:hypothetical protein